MIHEVLGLLGIYVRSISIAVKNTGALVFLIDVVMVGLAAMFIRHLGGRLPKRQVAIVGCAIGVLVAFFVFLPTDPRFFFEDFFSAYWPAGKAVLNRPSDLVPEMQRGVFGFVNLPIFAYAFAPFGGLSRPLAGLAFSLVGVLCLLAGIWSLRRAYALEGSRMGLLALGVLSFGPLIYSVRIGNTSHFLIGLLVGGAMLARGRRDMLAGMLLGFAALVKLPLLLVGAYFAIRGRWKVVAGGALVGLTAAFLSLLVFGWDINVLWFKACVLPFGDPIPGYNNQSIAGAAAKAAVGLKHNGTFEAYRFTGLAALGVKALSLSPLALIVWAVWRGRRAVRVEAWRGEAIEGEFMMVLTAACLMSPLAWSHYFVWLIPPGVFILTRPLSSAPDRWIKPTVLLGWALAMLPITDLQGLLKNPVPLTAWSVLGNQNEMVGSLLILAGLGGWRASVRPLANENGRGNGIRVADNGSAQGSDG